MTKACLTIVLLLCSVRGGFAQQQPAPAPAPPPPAAPAPAAPVYPVVRVGALSYLQYAAELENRDGYNSFDVTRAYLNINGQLSPNVRFRFTPDVRRISDGSLAGTLTVRVKYAFMQLDNVGAARSWTRLGQQQTPWLDFEEGVNRYRVQGTMFTEREPLIPGSADFGVSYFTPLPKGYGEIHGGVYNGEGYTQAEANKFKSFQGRLTVRPFPNKGLANGLRISGFYNAGWYAADRPRRLGIAMVSYEHRRLVATIERVAATERPLTATREFERRGWSAFVEPRQGPTGFAGIARVDGYDSDRALGDNSLRRVIVGGAYWRAWNTSRVGFVVTNEQVHYDAGAARPTENRLLLQTHVEF